MNTWPNVRAHARPHRFAPAARLAALALAATLLACAPRAHAQDATATPRPTPPRSQDTSQTPDAANNAAASKTSKSAAGSITGRVLGDGGEPLAGARIIILGASANRSNVEPAVTSDEAGNFRLDNLAPGIYQIGAALRGYVADPEFYPPGRPNALHRPGDTVTVRLIRGGVVTGTVTGADGEPLVAITVRAVYARDLEGDTSSAGFTFGADQTDDRGVYRIYGLRPGVYVVASAGSDALRPSWPGTPAPYRHEAPTYYPAGTRDTAAEVTVRGGQETAGIDIRHRGERGRRVTGLVVAGPGGTDAGALVTLTHAATGTQVGTAFTPQGANERSFAFEAVADGEYEVQARSSEGGQFVNTSPAVRVVVGGGDVTGLRLTLARLASVSGSLVVEPAAEAERAKGECKERRTTLLPQESVVTIQHEDPSKRNTAALRAVARRDASPDSSGAFTLRGLEAGRYRLDVRLADDNWYVRDVQFPAPPAPAPHATAKPGAARKPAAAATAATAATTSTASAAAPRESVELKLGQQLSGVTVRVADGAATLAGRVAPADDNAPLPPSARLRVHLVPAAREQADHALRYYETAPAADGSFTLKHLAPGRYFLLAREAEAEARARPAAWDASARARLRREAEAADIPVELQPCQRANDFAVKLPGARD